MDFNIVPSGKTDLQIIKHLVEFAFEVDFLLLKKSVLRHKSA